MNSRSIFKKAKLWLLFIFVNAQLSAQHADVVIFSYNRPMQLYAFLESLYSHASSVGKASVIYRSTDENYESGYGLVISAFPQVKFIRQTAPPGDFKPLVLEQVFSPESAEYIAFAVDDIIVKGKFDFNECIEALEHTHAYAFYLRLGLNLQPPIPEAAKVSDKIYFWQFKKSQGDWAYPNTVDMALYRKKDLTAPFNEMAYDFPNPLESHWTTYANLEQFGLCYETSKIVNIPLNVVNNSYTSHLNIHPQELLNKFHEGFKIDISQFFEIDNKFCHEEIPPAFILR